MIKFLKYVIIWIGFFLFFQNCRYDSEVIQINLNDFEHVEVLYFSDIIDSVFFIPLDRQNILNRIGNLVLSDRLLYVGEIKGAIHSYSWNGDYFCRYGDYGKGPGEYKYSWLFDVNKEGEVYLLQTDKKIITIYEYNGDWKGEIPYYDYLVNGSRFNELVCFNSSIFLKERFSDRGYRHYDWLVLDSSGKEINRKVTSEHERLNFGPDCFFKVEDYVCYWDPYRDTIYQIDDKGVYTPRFLWKKGKLRLPQKELKVTIKGEYVDISDSEYFRFMRFIELPNGNIYAAFKFGGNYYHSLYDKTIKRWKYSADFEDDLTGYSEKRNLFHFKVSSTCRGHFVSETIAPVVLKNWIESNHFEKIRVKTPWFKQQLKELADRLDEEDNAVVVVYRLKK